MKCKAKSVLNKHTCRVIERETVIEDIVWCHPKAVIYQSSHAVVPENKNGVRYQQISANLKMQQTLLYLCLLLC